MAVDTKSAGEAAAIRSSADLDTAIARIDQQAAAADRAIAELKTEKERLVGAAYSSDDPDARAQLETLNSKIRLEELRKEDLASERPTLVKERTAAVERERRAENERLNAQTTRLAERAAAAAEHVREVASGELRAAVTEYLRLRDRWIVSPFAPGGDVPPARPVDPYDLLGDVAALAGLPRPPTRMALADLYGELRRAEAGGFHAGRAAGRREAFRGQGPTSFQKNPRG